MACAFSSTPGDQNTSIVYRDIRLERHRVQTPLFVHYTFAKSGCHASSSGDPLLVFLDGDGNSWIREGTVSEDPTPPDPIALDLMIADAGCGLYVSRSCTFGLATSDPRCNAAAWTVDRYSEQAVASLASAIDQTVQPRRSLVLVGYSGGGLLAIHLANRISSVKGVITLAANLDLAAWVAHHGYTPQIVARSAPSPFPMRAGLVALHVFGARDRIAPASLSAAVVSSDSELVLDDIDHACCWTREWPRIRAAFQQWMEKASRMRTSSSLR